MMPPISGAVPPVKLVAFSAPPPSSSPNRQQDVNEKADAHAG
jgi:hypothetical protein